MRERPHRDVCEAGRCGQGAVGILAVPKHLNIQKVLNNVRVSSIMNNQDIQKVTDVIWKNYSNKKRENPPTINTLEVLNVVQV